MVDIKSPTAKIRREKPRRRKNRKVTTAAKYNVSNCYAGGRNDDVNVDRIYERRPSEA